MHACITVHIRAVEGRAHAHRESLSAALLLIQGLRGAHGRRVLEFQRDLRGGERGPRHPKADPLGLRRLVEMVRHADEEGGVGGRVREAVDFVRGRLHTRKHAEAHMGRGEDVSIQRRQSGIDGGLT